MQHKPHPSELCTWSNNSPRLFRDSHSHTAVAKSARTSARDLRYAGNPQGRQRKSRYWVRDWGIAGMFSNGVYVLATRSSARRSWPRLALHKKRTTTARKHRDLISRLLRVHGGVNAISATRCNVNIFHPAARKSRSHRSLPHAAASLVSKQANWSPRSHVFRKHNCARQQCSLDFSIYTVKQFYGPSTIFSQNKRFREAVGTGNNDTDIKLCWSWLFFSPVLLFLPSHIPQ